MDQELTDYGELGVVELADTKWMPYVELSNKMSFEEMNQYFTIEFENYKWNPEETGEKRIQKHVTLGRQCTDEQDFYELEESLTAFDEELGVHKYCMLEDTDDTFQLEGYKQELDEKIKTLHIKVYKCENKLDDFGHPIGIIDSRKNHTDKIDYIEGITCKSEEEIAEFFDNHGKFRINYLAQKFATTKYEDPPVFTTNNWLRDYNLYLDRYDYTQAALQENTIIT